MALTLTRGDTLAPFPPEWLDLGAWAGRAAALADRATRGPWAVEPAAPPPAAPEPTPITDQDLRLLAAAIAAGATTRPILARAMREGAGWDETRLNAVIAETRKRARLDALHKRRHATT